MATPISIVPRKRPAAPEPVAIQPEGPQKLPGTRIQVALLGAAVFLVAAIVHSQTLGFKLLTTWDDPSYVTFNPWISLHKKVGPKTSHIPIRFLIQTRHLRERRRSQHMNRRHIEIMFGPTV